MKDGTTVLLYLTKTFQMGSVKFTQITPGTKHAISKLKQKRDQKPFKTI